MALLASTTETAAPPARAAAFSYPDARRYVAPARAIGADRRSLGSPAAQLSAQFRPGQSVVLGDVTVTDLDDARCSGPARRGAAGTARRA